MSDPSKNKLAHLASLVQEMENKVSRNSKNDSMMAALNQLSSLEEALRLEISRRTDMESRISESVDGKIKVSVDRLADAVETEMTRMYRKMDLELSNKIETISRDVQSLQAGRIAMVERRIEATEDLARRSSDAITRLETRLTALVAEMPSTSANALASEQTKLIVTEAVVRLRAEIDDTLQEVRRSKQLADKQLSELRTRLEFESAGLRAELHAEAETRDLADKDLAEVVTQYAEVMHRRLAN